MNQENILDFNPSKKENNPIFEAISWWEKKRLFYNIALIGTELFLMYYYLEGTKLFGIKNAILESLGYTIAANIFYSFGWGLEVLSYYYFNTKNYLKKYRIIILIAGFSFTIFATIFAYGITLSNLEWIHSMQ